MGEKVMDGKKEKAKKLENEKNTEEEVIEEKKEAEEKKSDAKENKEIKNEETKNEEEQNKFEKSKEKPKEQEKEINKMELNTKKVRNKKRYIILAVVIGLILIIGLFVSTIFALANISNNNIINGISIAGIDVSRLSKEDAKAKIEAIYNEKKEKDIPLKHGEYETTLSPILMEVNYKIDEAVEKAYSIGKSSNIFVNNYNILFALITKKDIPLEMTLNEEVTKQMIDDMNINLPDVVIESSYSVEDDELIITKGKAGIKIDAESLLSQVKERLNSPNTSNEVIDIPVINKEPDPIDIDKIHEDEVKES